MSIRLSATSPLGSSIETGEITNGTILAEDLSSTLSSDLVHISGTETITGAKTFSSTVSLKPLSTDVANLTLYSSAYGVGMDDSDMVLFAPAAAGVEVKTDSQSGNSVVRFSATGCVFNEGGADTDFRIESDTDPNCLFVDAGADRVAIGAVAAPYATEKLAIHPATNVNITIHHDGAGSGRIFSRDDGGNTAPLDIRGSVLTFAGAATFDSSVTATSLVASGSGTTFDASLLKNLDANGAVATSVSQVFQLQNSVGIIQSRITAKESTVDATQADIIFETANGTGGVSTERMRIGGATATVVNEDGADYDFRVEGDTDANLLFCDASTDRIGIKTASPAAPLDIAVVNGTALQITSSSFARISKSGAGNFEISTNTAGSSILLRPADSTALTLNDLNQAIFAGDAVLATKTPSTAGAGGTAGTFAWDASYIYVCTATNTWKRVAISTW